MLVKRSLSSLNRYLSAEVLDYYQSEISVAWSLYQKDLASSFGWYILRDGDNMTILRNSQFPNKIQRKGLLEVPPSEIIKFLSDLDNWRKWNEVCMDVHFIQKLGAFNVIYYRLSLCWPIADRDFVVVGSVKELSDGTVAYVLRSVEHEEKAVKKDAIRANIKYAVFAAVPTDWKGISSDLTYMTDIDMIGVPQVIGEEANRKRDNAIQHIRDHLGKSTFHWLF